MSEPILQPSGRKFFTFWTIAWVCAWAGLFVVMHNPAPRGLALPPNSDKVIHFCAYFALAMMGVRSAFSRQVKLDARWLVKWIIIYTVYCAADELLQGPVGRHPSLYDWLADIAGAAAALGIAYVNRPGEPESQE